MEQKEYCIWAWCSNCDSEVAVCIPKGEEYKETTCGRCDAGILKKKSEKEQKTLRDEFAMAALTGMIVVTGKGYLCHPTDLENFAHDAFRYADAMMKERENYNKE